MTDETIQEDVSEESEAVVNEADNQAVDVRADAIEALADKREAEILAESGEDASDESDEAVEEPTDDEEVVQEETEKEPMVKVKVDGEEQELPLSEVIKNYQKEATADKRLREAAEERHRLEQLRNEIEQERSKPVEEEQLPDNDADLTDAERIAAAFDNLSYGTDDEKAEASRELKALLGRSDNPTIPVEQITQQAAQQAIYQMQYQEAEKRFLEGYQDIVSDPTLYQMAANEYSKQLQNAETYEQAFTAAGDAVRQWKDKLIGGASKTSSRMELKQNLPKEPNKLGSRVESAPVEKEETPSDIIAAMARARGQV